MLIHIVGIAALILAFVVGTFTSLNLGTLALVASFGIGAFLLHEEPKEILQAFPGDLFVLIFGVTYLFGIAAVNGTLEWFVNRLVGLVGGQKVLVPPLVFAISCGAVSIGALAPSVCAVFAPVAMRVARQLDISRVLMGVMVTQGGIAGALTPIGGLGPIVNNIVDRNGVDLLPSHLYLMNLGFNIALGVVAYAVFGGLKLVRTATAEVRTLQTAASGGAGLGIAYEPTGTQEEKSPEKPTPAVLATLGGIAALALGLLVFQLDVGFLALTIAVVLHICFPQASKGAMDKVSWPVIVLICGVVTYLTVLQRAGTIDLIGGGVAGIRPAIAAVLVLCVVAAFVSAFASSTATIATIVPLAIPLVGLGSISGGAVIAAIAICAIAVDSSPLSSTGAVVVASAVENDQRAVYQGLLRWGLAMIVVAPVLSVAGIFLFG